MGQADAAGWRRRRWSSRVAKPVPEQGGGVVEVGQEERGWRRSRPGQWTWDGGLAGPAGPGSATASAMPSAARTVEDDLDQAAMAGGGVEESAGPTTRPGLAGSRRRWAVTDREEVVGGEDGGRAGQNAVELGEDLALERGSCSGTASMARSAPLASSKPAAGRTAGARDLGPAPRRSGRAAADGRGRGERSRREMAALRRDWGSASMATTARPAQGRRLRRCRRPMMPRPMTAIFRGNSMAGDYRCDGG